MRSQLSLLTATLLVSASHAAHSQGWSAGEDFFRPPWYESYRPRQESYREPRQEHYAPRIRPSQPQSWQQRQVPDDKGEVRDGGARPDILPVPAPVVAFDHAYPAKSIVIDSGGRKLYYVLGGNRAYAYPISVGRDGFNWSGTEVVSRKQAWPDWHPPAEMRERDPKVPQKMTGGLKNPLGAYALYLGKTLYRIHGTNDVKSIGLAQSSGCFRMLNSAVLHLASLTDIGTPVSVVTSLPAPVPAPAVVSQAPPEAYPMPPSPRRSTSSPSNEEYAQRRFAFPPSAMGTVVVPLPDYLALRNHTLGIR